MRTKLTAGEVKHGWRGLTPKLKKSVIAQLENLIANGSERAKGIAIHNLLLINKQNMELDKSTVPEQQITIKIEEDDGRD